ncbi:MAG: hypothetical protein QOH60_5142 [Mycobacterium sp.]|nr:hypothetical protein [Mycobacterium sp.]
MFTVHRLWIALYIAVASAALVIGSDYASDTKSYDITLAATREVHELTAFRSPSGNIGCYIEPNYVRCDIRDRAWSPPPRPADCPGMTDYGQGIALKAGAGASFVCAGDTALNDGLALGYGEKITAGSIECTSQTSGMNCWDFQYGHEFALSREGYQIR